MGLDLDQLTDDERVAVESCAKYFGLRVLDRLFAGIASFTDDARAAGMPSDEIGACVAESIDDCVSIVIRGMVRQAIKESSARCGQP
jgi:hypothetical protein